MTPASRLGKQLAEVATALAEANVPFALIGGLALASHKVVRATQDVDLLVDLDNADVAEHKLAGLGYHRLHRSADAGNYVRSDERVDLLYASRPAARRLLAGASGLVTPFGNLRIVMASSMNETDAPLAADGGLPQVAVNVSNPYEALDDLMVVIEALCPTWPPRPPMGAGEFKL